MGKAAGSCASDPGDRKAISRCARPCERPELRRFERSGVAGFVFRRAPCRRNGERQQNSRVGPLTDQLLIIGMRHRDNSKTGDIRRPIRATAEPSPVSAARRAAEAAFAAPVLPAAVLAVPVQVVSVRRRLREMPNQRLPIADVVADQPAAKTPRVFRLHDTHNALIPAPAQPEKPEELPRRRRRVNTSRRPGPVQRSFARGPETASAEPAVARTGQPSRREQLDELRRMLSDLDQTFAQIRFAQHFRI
jgi:hypothetical protein